MEQNAFRTLLVVSTLLTAPSCRESPEISTVDALPSSALPPLPAEARGRMEHMLGRWRVKEERFDGSGGIAGTREWENYAEYLLDGRLVLLTHDAAKHGTISKTLVFYSHDDEKWYLVDVNQKGELWILSGNLDRYVITSQPRRTSDGREMIVRFTHENIEEDSVEALMEYSFDGGSTWTEGSRQHLTRVR